MNNSNENHASALETALDRMIEARNIENAKRDAAFERLTASGKHSMDEACHAHLLVDEMETLFRVEAICWTAVHMRDHVPSATLGLSICTFITNGTNWIYGMAEENDVPVEDLGLPANKDAFLTRINDSRKVFEKCIEKDKAEAATAAASASLVA